MEFYGRQQEILELRKIAAPGAGSKLVAVYGRRRVGKTRLIEEAFAKQTRFFKFEGLEAEPTYVQQSHFLARLGEISNQPLYKSARPGSWTEILGLLSGFLGRERSIILFDEFQWMAAERHQLVSELKYCWDNLFLKNNNVTLVLCGSISSFLIKKVVQSKALYGRFDLIIPVQPLAFSMASRFVCPKRSAIEALRYYFCFGGVPQYWKLVRTSESFVLNLERLFFSGTGILFHEFDALFASHFGKNRTYRRILDALSHAPFLTRGNLQKKCRVDSGGTLSELVEDLELAGFIEKYPPADKPGASRLIRFRLSDPYLLFYFRFILPNKKSILSGDKPRPLTHFVSDKMLEVWQGLAFEHFCITHQGIIADILGFGGIRYKAGSYFARRDNKTGFQIDLVYFRADQVVTVCEIKFHERAIDASIIRDFGEKLRRFAVKPGITIEKVLITRSAPTESLKSEGYFHRIVMLDEILAKG